jgi:hypothetical protein
MNVKTRIAARVKPTSTPDENGFAALDAWARNLTLNSGQPLHAAQPREEKLARSVGRPANPELANAKRVMISIAPSSIEAAGSTQIARAGSCQG